MKHVVLLFVLMTSAKAGMEASVALLPPMSVLASTTIWGISRERVELIAACRENHDYCY